MSGQSVSAVSDVHELGEETPTTDHMTGFGRLVAHVGLFIHNYVADLGSSDKDDEDDDALDDEAADDEAEDEDDEEIQPLLDLAVFGLSMWGTARAGREVGKKLIEEHQNQLEVPQLPQTGLSPSAGWYLDPLDWSRLRYWDGARWTELARSMPHTMALPPAGWYPDNSNSRRIRYWNGSEWTERTRRRPRRR